MSETLPAAEAAVETLTYQVPAHNLDKLQAQVAGLNKKVARLQKKGYAVDPVVIQVGPAYLKEVTKVDSYTEERVTREIPFHEVVLVSPKPPKVEGWEFVAAVTHLGEVGAVLRNVPGAVVAEGELAAYRTASAENCDHCKVRNSRRTETFILRAPEGALKQVGRNCLQAFTGLKNPEWLCQAAEYLMAARDMLGAAEDDGEGFEGGSSRGYASVEAFMPFVVASCRLAGWLSRGKAFAQGGMSTCEHALSHGLFASDKDPHRFEPEAQDIEKAKACLAFLDEKFSDPDFKPYSDYESNLRVCILGGVLLPKLSGIIASAYPYWNREVERQVRKSAWVRIGETSKHIGEVKARLVFHDAQVMGHREFDSDFGVRNLYTFIVDGSVVKYWTGNNLGIKMGDVVSFKASVKAHGEYKGVKETTVTRASRVIKATVTKYEVVERDDKYGRYDESGAYVTETKHVVSPTWTLDDNAGHTLTMVVSKPSKKLVASLSVGAEVFTVADWHSRNIAFPVSLLKD